MFFQSVVVTTPTGTQHSNKSYFTISKELDNFSPCCITPVYSKSVALLYSRYMCLLYTFMYSDRNPQIAQKKYLSFPLLNLLGGSANVALIHLGGKSERVQRLPEALLLGADVDEHQGL